MQFAIDTLQKISHVIKNMRLARGLSQEMFCAECGVDQHYISNIENGQRNLSVTLVEKIAKYFGLPLSEFFGAVEHTGTVLKDIETKTRDSVFEPRKEPSVKYSSVAIKDQFIAYMKRQGLKVRTINSYIENTPNSADVHTTQLSQVNNPRYIGA